MNYLIVASAPLSGWADSYVSYASATLLALLGLNYYAFIWAFVGACVALGKTEKLSKGRAILYVMLSTAVGALLGTVAAERFEIKAASIIAIMALLGGMGWQGITAALLQSFRDRIVGAFPGALRAPSPSPPPPAGSGK